MRLAREEPEDKYAIAALLYFLELRGRATSGSCDEVLEDLAHSSLTLAGAGPFDDIT